MHFVAEESRLKLSRLWPGICVLLSAPAGAAGPALTRSEQELVHFGFATQLGSGVYSISGRTLQVYRLPFELDLPAAGTDRRRVRVTLPVTIGIADFEPQDVLESGLPDQLDSLSFVPGLAVEFDVGEHWRVEPYVEAGLARDRSGDFDSRVYSVGLRGWREVELPHAAGEFYAELVHGGVDQRTPDISDDFTLGRLGFSARRPFGSGDAGEAAGGASRPDVLGYGLVEWLADAPDGPVAAEGDPGAELQYEIGLSFGYSKTRYLWHIPLPRVGLAYRFGDRLSVYRLVLGMPF